MEEKIRHLMENYPLEVKQLYRARGAWLCETNKGLKLIRIYKGAPKRLECEMMVKSCLRERGCMYIDQIVANSEGACLTEETEGEAYVLTDWYSGRECNTRDKEEVLTAVVHMAGIHRKMCDFQYFSEESGEGQDTKNIFYIENMYEETKRRSKELRTIRNYVMHKKQKNDFDRLFMKVYSEFESDGERAKNILMDMDYLNLYEQACQKHCLCHGDYNQHNLLMTREGIALVRFDQMHFELHIYDLYVFMRKVLEKNRWNIGLGVAMVRAYQRVLPMEYREARCLYALMLFPEKFWKISNRYHNSRKSWMSAQNMSKLEKLIREKELKQHFLTALDEFCEQI